MLIYILILYITSKLKKKIVPITKPSFGKIIFLAS